MIYLKQELLEKAEELREDTDALTAYYFLVEFIKLELKHDKRSDK